MATTFTPAQLLGSKTARDGFSNEGDVREKFNNWKNDLDAQDWLLALGYNPNDIKTVSAKKAPPRIKPDISVAVTKNNGIISTEWISIKLVSNVDQGFNQVDKRWVDDYISLWGIPTTTSHLLKLFTGEISHSNLNARDERRLFLDELNQGDRTMVVDFFKSNKQVILSDLFEGRSTKANWMMVTAKSGGKVYWKIRSMAYALNLFSTGDVEITARGSLKIGSATMQRKGGDNGRPSANMLQFKANPLLLF